MTLYLSRSVNMELEPKLRRELRPGARIVSHQFPIGRWMPDERIRVDGEDVFPWVLNRGQTPSQLAARRTRPPFIVSRAAG